MLSIEIWRHNRLVKMNVFTFTEDGKCDDVGCKVPSVDLDWEGKLIVHYTISGSPKVWTFDEELDLETWYEVEIKQYKDGNKVV